MGGLVQDSTLKTVLQDSEANLKKQLETDMKITETALKLSEKS
ncbi:hypothetical protein [Cytobacillus firmus]|nr:hypothetical protein [Cytobacillus firmus]